MTASEHSPPRRDRGRAAALAILAALAGAQPARADEAQARALFKAMSDYLAAQSEIGFDYDSSLDVVTTDGQKLALASSGSVALARPDKLRATRDGGFASVEAVFDGKTLTLLSKADNRYAQFDVPGTLDHLIDIARDDLHRPLPAADLLLGDVDTALAALAVDVKDLGSGVIGGVECDHLAFRGEDADWQIWIAQGDQPYPCRYAVTAPKVTGWPQYTVDVRNWRTGAEASADFAFQPPAGATKADAADIPALDEVTGIYAIEEGN